MNSPVSFLEDKVQTCHDNISKIVCSRMVCQ